MKDKNISGKCKNGCDAERYTARLVCKACVCAEVLERKRAKEGGPKPQGRKKQIDGRIQQQQNATRPLDGFNSLMARMAMKPLRFKQ